MLIPGIGVAMAQEEAPPAVWGPYAGANQFCITGSVINFDETPLAENRNGDPWVITATPTGSTGGTALTAMTDEDGLFEFEDLDPGTWTIAITLEAGWEMVDPYLPSVDVVLDYGHKKCAEVRFKLRYPIGVDVYKVDDNHLPLEGWTIRATPARGNWFASPVEVETDAAGLAHFDLTHGKWIFTERAPKGTHFVAVMPTSGQQEIFVDAEDVDAEPIVLRFKNRILTKGCIVVTKSDVVPDNLVPGSVGLPGWKMTVKRLNGTIAATGVTDARGEVTFKDLPYGPYIVEEEHRLGWAAEGATAIQVVLAPPAAGTEVVCEAVDFLNRQSPAGFCIEGRKIDANGHIGLPNWPITITPVSKGGFPDPNVDVDETGAALSSTIELTTTGTGDFSYTFPLNDYRIPGAAYKVCEEMLDGWLPHTATCRTVYLPHKPGACVRVPDFVNQQVGHSEAMAYGRHTGGSAGCATTHTVVAGESLFGIGNAYGVSGGSMLSANPWVYNRHNRYVFPGDVVCIP
jgi:hypothetical protein